MWTFPYILGAVLEPIEVDYHSLSLIFTFCIRYVTSESCRIICKGTFHGQCGFLDCPRGTAGQCNHTLSPVASDFHALSCHKYISACKGYGPFFHILADTHSPVFASDWRHTQLLGPLVVLVCHNGHSCLPPKHQVEWGEGCSRLHTSVISHTQVPEVAIPLGQVFRSCHSQHI